MAHARLDQQYQVLALQVKGECFNAERRQNAFIRNSREAVLLDKLLCVFLFLESKGFV